MNTNLSGIKDSVQKGDLENAGQQLLELMRQQSSSFQNEVIVNLANLRQVITDERKGIVSSEITKRNKTQIMYALLDLIDEFAQEIVAKGVTDSSNTLTSDQRKEIILEGSLGQVIIQESDSGDKNRRLNQLRKLHTQHIDNLQKLKEQEALFGVGQTPLHLINQIEAEEKAIEEIQVELEALIND